MKKLFLLLFFTTLFLNSFAQKLDFYATFGGTVSTLGIDKGSATTIASKSPVANFSGSFLVDMQYGAFSVQPALLIAGKGGNYVDTQGIPTKLSIAYFEAPIHLVYNSSSGFYFGAGPYFSAGIGGKIRTEYPGKTVKADLRMFKKSSDYRIGDLGGSGIIGYKFKSGFIVNATYEMGVANILADKGNTTGDQSMKTRTIGVSIGHVL